MSPKKADNEHYPYNPPPLKKRFTNTQVPEIVVRIHLIECKNQVDQSLSTEINTNNIKCKSDASYIINYKGEKLCNYDSLP